MSVLFVHGVPDTPNLWTPLVKELKLKPGEYHAPALPGFGAAAPESFSASKEAYADWLAHQVKSLYDRTGPVHVVGHDWGGILTLRVAHLHPEWFKSWTILNASVQADLQWHRMARLWQTPIRGELSMMLLRGGARDRKLQWMGMSDRLLRTEGPHINAEMKRSILRLYRSAVNLGPEWGRDISGLPAHGCIIACENDHFVPPRVARDLSKRSGAPLYVIPAAGHWTIYDSPARFTRLIAANWLASMSGSRQNR